MPSHAADGPSNWIVRWSHLIAPAARVLDLACGHGRHARWCASRGCGVLAVDRDQSVLDSLAGVPNVRTLHIDIESDPWPFQPSTFDAVIVTNYLHRPLFAHIADSLKAGGVLLYETFMQGNERFGKPSNPDFLLARDELLEQSARLRLAVVAFEQGMTELPKPAIVQRLCAVVADPADYRDHRLAS